MPNYAQKFFTQSVTGLITILQRIAGMSNVQWIPRRVAGSDVVVCESSIADSTDCKPSSNSVAKRVKQRDDLELRLATLKQIFNELKKRGKNFVYAANSKEGSRYQVFLGTENLVDAVSLAGEIVDTVLTVLVNEGIDDEFTEGLNDICEQFEILFNGPGNDDEENEEIPLE